MHRTIYKPEIKVMINLVWTQKLGLVCNMTCVDFRCTHPIDRFIWTPNISWHAIFFMCHEIFEVMNSHACVCVLNNLLLIIIMTTILIVVLKKMTHNSLTF
jgi:hypothetical protein